MIFIFPFLNKAVGRVYTLVFPIRLPTILYQGTNSHFKPASFGVQIYQPLVPIQNGIEAGSVVVMTIPVIVLILSQRLFMRSVTIIGLETRQGFFL